MQELKFLSDALEWLFEGHGLEGNSAVFKDKQEAKNWLLAFLSRNTAPSEEEMVIQFLEACYDSPRHILHGAVAESRFPAPLIAALLREGLVTRSINGYRLLQSGVDMLTAYAKKNS